MENERIQLGTAEVPKLAKNTIKLRQVQNKKNKLHHGLKYEVVYGIDITGNEVNEIRKKSLLGEKRTKLSISQNDKYLKHIRKNRNPLKHMINEIGRDKLDEETYKKLIFYNDKQQIKKQIAKASLYRNTKKLIENENIADDELMSDLKGKVKNSYYGTRLSIKGNVRKIHNLNNNYARLGYAKEKEWLLEEQRKHILAKGKRADYREQIKSASSQIQKSRLKKEMVAAVKSAEGNFIRRNLHQVKVKVKTVNRIRKTVKRLVSTVMSISALFVIFLSLFGIGFIIILGLLESMAEFNEKAVTQNDYGVLSETAAYLKKLETDLEEELNDKETLEEKLQQEYGPDIYEFHYELAELGFSNNTLMAYLSAKYGSFKLEDISGELEELFEAMYELKIEIKEEMREVVDETQTDPETGEHPVVQEMKKICYITLEKVELEEVVAERMSEEEKEKYNMYITSSGGQQVYGPVMEEDWTDLISSDYGERIHPITGERTFHNGIDIAIPTGTPLYSAVKGKVILAQYSESAGNYMKVQTESRWVVIFMHMDSIAVQPGQEVEKGDFVGNSGNTGRSTGPHLHLEIRDSNGNPVNPYFIVPQNCKKLTETEE